MPGNLVAVVGSVIEDHVFRVEALPLPGESAISRTPIFAPGGKGANQATAARRLGAPTLLVARVGDDEAGRAARRDLEANGVELAWLVTPDAATGHAAVVVESKGKGENMIAVYPGANDRLRTADLEPFRPRLESARVLVTQLEVPAEAVRAVAEIANATGATSILNAAPVRSDARELAAGFDLLVVNETEAELLAEVGISGIDDAMAALRAIRDLGVSSPIITLGAEGALYVDRGRIEHARSPEVRSVDATGAGDAFVGALAALLSEGRPLSDAVPEACVYAAHSTTSLGARAGYADRATFDAFLQKHGPEA